MSLEQEIIRILRKKLLRYKIVRGKNWYGKYKDICIYTKLRNYSILLFKKEVKNHKEAKNYKYDIVIHGVGSFMFFYLSKRDRRKILETIRGKIG